MDFMKMEGDLREKVHLFQVKEKSSIARHKDCGSYSFVRTHTGCYGNCIHFLGFVVEGHCGPLKCTFGIHDCLCPKKGFHLYRWLLFLVTGLQI